MITPGKHSFILYQGTTLRKVFTWTTNGTPMDLTGYTGHAQLRKAAGDTTPALDLSSDNGGIIVDGPSGQITLYASATDTEGLTADKYLYDLDITDPEGDVSRLVEGVITISKGITR